MPESLTITEAKARLSELVGRLLHGRDKIFITKKGKPAAVLLPVTAYEKLVERRGSGLLEARSALADLDSEVKAMTEAILAERAGERGREVDL